MHLRQRRTREKLVAQRRRYARVYKGIAVASVTFHERGGARKRADDLFLLKNKSEQSELCSDMAGAEGFEPSTCGFGDRFKSFYKAIYSYLYYFFTTFISNLPHPPQK